MKRQRKFETFFVFLTAFRSLVRGTKGKQIKSIIGDSVNNNRTLTVNQAIRFLNTINSKVIARELEQVFKVLEPSIRNNRKRSDSIDLEELTSTYRNIVMNKKQFRNKIGRVVKEV